MINVTRSMMPPLDEYIDEIRDIWDTRWLTNMGTKHKELQKRLQEYLKCDYIELVVNGHMALELSIQAFDLKGEVITTPFTFASTTHSIVRNGLKPVFCDINEEDYTIDTTKLESLINERTSAIVPVHVYGNICNIEEIDRIAQKHNLKVIYDAAHAFGETYKGKGVGTFGDASCFSFHATKVFHTIEGGAVSFRKEKIGNRIYELKNFGIHNEESVQAVGANAKMNEFCAAMGLCNLRHISEEIKERKKIFEKYNELLKDVEGIKLPEVQDMITPNYAYYPIVVNEKKTKINRNELICNLKENGIYARKYFYPLTCDFECYREEYSFADVPVARKVSQRVMTLPLYAGLENTQIEHICSVIKSSCQK